jgi:hypothetical protein
MKSTVKNMKGAGAPVVGMAEIIRRAKMSQKNPTMEKPAYPENMKGITSGLPIEIHSCSVFMVG